MRVKSGPLTRDFVIVADARIQCSPFREAAISFNAPVYALYSGYSKFQWLFEENATNLMVRGSFILRLRVSD